MIVEIAKFSGCCFGVKRAINIVEETTANCKSVKTYGPIIHNPQVVEKFKKTGVDVIKSVDEVLSTDSIVIRSHGATKDEIALIKSKAKAVIDATCPFVLKAQREAEKLSSKVDLLIIYGEENHPEVSSIISYVTSDYIVVSDISDLDKINYGKHYGVLSQTTQNKEQFKDLIFKLERKCDILKISDTICSATSDRQQSAVELAKSADGVIVVGGKNSANTFRLFEICSSLCKNTQYVETKEEIDIEKLKDCKYIGITAGASTPNEFVADVKEYICEKFNINK